MVGLGAHIPVSKVRGSTRDGRSIFMSLLAGMGAVGGRPQSVEASEGTGRARLCALMVRQSLDTNFCHRQGTERSEGR